MNSQLHQLRPLQHRHKHMKFSVDFKCQSMEQKKRDFIQHERELPDLPIQLLPAWLKEFLQHLGIVLHTSYTVEIVNATASTTFDEVDIFYKRVGQPGVVFLTTQLAPNEKYYFNLGPCNEMESYVVGFFVGETLVIKIPPEGNMTPELASQIKPSDTDSCADAWLITD